MHERATSMNEVLDRPRTDPFIPEARPIVDEHKPLSPEEVAARNKELADKNEAEVKRKGEEARAKYKIIDKADYRLTKTEFLYPFEGLAVGQGFFVPLEHPNTMDILSYNIHRQVSQFKLQNSQAELNEDGDDVLENVTIRSRIRNKDGSFALDGSGNPKLSASSVSRPKLIGPSFIVKHVLKDDLVAENTKSEADGVLVIRVD